MSGGVLVIQPLPGIGDMVWHLPHIHALAAAAPEGKVWVLTKPRSQADRLLAADPAVAGVLWLERNPGRHDGLRGLLRLARELRARGFREAWVLHTSARYALAARLAGIPRRFGFGFGTQRLWLSGSARLGPAERRLHPLEKADRLLERAGVPRREEEPVLPVAEGARAAAARRTAGLPRPLVALGVGTSEPYKQWGAERFVELAARLRARAGGFVVVGGPAEAELAARVAAGIAPHGARARAVHDAPIDEVAALLEACDLYVGNDTGVLNVAAAVGTRAVGLFGASPPLRHSRRIHAVVPRPGGGGMSAIAPGAVARMIEEEGWLQARA